MLTSRQIDHFKQKGYLIFEGLIPSEKVEYYVSVFDQLVQHGKSLTEHQGHYALEIDKDRNLIPGILHKVQGVCVEEPRILQLAKEPGILDRIQCLLGPDIDIFGTKFFPKLPQVGHSVYWHQDNFYFGTTSDQIISCGIYLQDTDRENGCLRIIPSSHLRGAIFSHHRDPTTHGSWAEIDDREAIDVEMSAGTVAIFSANLMHGAYDNNSERSRYSTAWHYIPGELQLEQFPRGGYEDRHIVLGD